MKKVVLIIGLLVNFLVCSAKDNGPDKLQFEVKDQKELPSWADTLMSKDLPPGKGYLFAIIDRGGLRVYRKKAGEEAELVYKDDQVSNYRTSIIGFNRAGTLLAVLDKKNQALKIYNSNEGKDWRLLKESHDYGSQGLWTPADLLATMDTKRKLINIYRVLPSGEIRLVELPFPYEPFLSSIGLFEEKERQTVSRAIPVSSVKKREVKSTLPWYSRLMAYIRNAIGY